MDKLKSANKITLATFKSFIKRNESKLYVKEKSSFDGMVDCVMPIDNSGFKKAERIEGEKRRPFVGVWLVGSSRDYFTLWEDERFTGIEIYNCCGVSIVAIKKG